MSDSRDYKSILLGESLPAVIQMIVITQKSHRSLLNLLSLQIKLSLSLYKWDIVMDNLNKINKLE